VQDSNRGLLQYQYDGRDRVTLITQPTGYKMAYLWDANSNRTIMTATAGSTVKATSYTYDDALRLKTVKGADDGSGQSQYFYDPVGMRTKLTLPNNISVTYEYDTLNRMRAITQTQGASTVLASYRYDLGLAGNKTRVVEKDNSSTEWSYDDSYRLTSEVRKNTVGTVLTTTNYTYDKTGNRLQQTVNGSPVMTGTYNELDQLISDGTKQYTYDGRGNLTQITGGTKYKWDGADRLISATVTGGTALYVYDADGRRVKQTQGTTVTNYLWDEESAYGDVVYETDGTNSTSYTLGGSELISQKRSASANAEYFLMDGHSGIRSLTNNSGGVIENYRYDAFGNLQNFSGTPNTKYLYTEQQFDTLTSLYSLRARYYNPSYGRFLSKDKWDIDFTDPMQLSRYIYAISNPINTIDPSGNEGLVGYLTSFTNSAKWQPYILGLAGLTYLQLLLLLAKLKDITITDTAPKDEDNEDKDAFVVRAGVATPQRLQAGVAEHYAVPGLTGFSVQSEPRLTYFELAAAGQFPNPQISVTTVGAIEAVGRALGYDVSVVKSPGKGYHKTVKTPKPLPDDLAQVLSQVFTQMPNPSPIKGPQGR